MSILAEIRRVNDTVVRTAGIADRRVAVLRRNKHPFWEHAKTDITRNWAEALLPHYDRWANEARRIVEKSRPEELLSLDPHYGVICFDKTLAFSEHETPVTAMVRIVCGLAATRQFDNNHRVLFSLLEGLLYGTVAPPTPLLTNSGSTATTIEGEGGHYQASSVSCYLIAGPEEGGASEAYTADIMSLIAKMTRAGGAIGMNMSAVRAGLGPGACIPTAVLYSRILTNYPKSKFRASSATLYLEPWHADFEQFIRLQHPQRKWQRDADRIFPAVWMNDLFMETLQKRGVWHMFDPARDPRIGNLVRMHGDAFRAEYTSLVEEGLFAARKPAMEIFKTLASTIIATGGPFVLFKDHINRVTCHSQVYGTITSSNLCTEIVQYHSPREVATCNLMSINVDRVFASQFDCTLLRPIVATLVEVTTRRIFTPLPLGAAGGFENHGLKSRAIGIGIQGYADLLSRLEIDYLESGDVLASIFEHLYYYALEASCALVATFGRFEGFERSYYAKGQLHFDHFANVQTTTELDWADLRDRIKTTGLANSLLIAQMPTSHSATLWNNSEWFEARNKPVQRRKTAVADCFVINKDIERGDPAKYRSILQRQLTHPGHTDPDYETCWDLPMDRVLEVWAKAVPFIDQSASLSWHLTGKAVNVGQGLVRAWRLQFKTALYYMRIRPHGSNKQFFKLSDAGETAGTDECGACTC